MRVLLYRSEDQSPAAQRRCRMVAARDPWMTVSIDVGPWPAQERSRPRANNRQVRPLRVD